MSTGQEPPISDGYTTDHTKYTCPLGLYYCPLFSNKEVNVIQHIISLTPTELDSVGGCNLSNESLANAFRMGVRSVTRAISKAKALGFISTREDYKYWEGGNNFKQARRLQMKLPEEWGIFGDLYHIAQFNPYHKNYTHAKDFVHTVEKYCEGNPDATRKEIYPLIKQAEAKFNEAVVSTKVPTRAVYSKTEEYPQAGTVTYDGVQGGRSQLLGGVKLTSPPDQMDEGGYSHPRPHPLATHGQHICIESICNTNNHSDCTGVPAEHSSEVENPKPPVAPPSPLRTKIVNSKNKEELAKDTVAVLELWNKQPNLTTHKVVATGTRVKRYPLVKQTATVRKINDLVQKVMHKKFFGTRTEIQDANVKRLNISLQQFKVAITRANLSGNSEYNTNHDKMRRLSLSSFMYNQFAPFNGDDGKDKRFKYRYPLIHFLLNKPEKVSNRPFKTKTDHKRAVTYIMAQLAQNGSFKGTERDHNEVVRHVELAAKNVRENANGTAGQIIDDLGTHIINCLRSNGGIKLDNMFVTVQYKLIPYLRERRHL